MRLITHPLLKLSLATITTVAVLTSLPSKVMAIGFTGDYATSNWTLTNSNADGDVDITNAGLNSIDLIGGNNGSTTPGTTDWTIAITPARAGTLIFTWSYGSLDSAGNDVAGYLYNGTFTQLATTDGQLSSSPVTFTLNDGDTFGFRVETLTNDGGAGALSVSNFNVQPVPFEFEGSAGILTIGAIWGINKWCKNRVKK
jgi:hypothetical protein